MSAPQTSDRVTAWVRTVVPTLWSALVAWLVSLGLPPTVTGAAAGLVDVLVVPAALAAVYALIRWAEPRIPDWLTVVLLGSARTPMYGTDRAAGGVVSAGTNYVVGEHGPELWHRLPTQHPIVDPPDDGRAG